MRGSIRKRGNVYYYRYRENGKLIEKRAGSKEEAEKKLTEIMYRRNTGYIPSADMLLKDYMDMWLEDYVKEEKSENTYDKYLKTSKKYIIPILGDIKLNELKVVHIEKFIRELRKNKLSPTSVQTYYG